MMDSIGQTVTFPMLLQDDGGTTADAVITNEMAATRQQSFVFAPNLSDGTATLLLFHNSQPVPQNTTNIIIKQAPPNNTIFLDSSQMALLSSGAGQVVLTGSQELLEDGQQVSEPHQIFLQVASNALVDNPKHVGALDPLRVEDKKPVRKRGPGRPKRDDSKMMPPSVKGVWYCQVCGKEFTKWPMLKKHLKSHSDDKPHRCSTCTASFNVAWNLKLHEATHLKSSTSPLSCPACSRTFSRMASLKAHVMVHEEDESLFCPLCAEEFSTQLQLDDHMSIHGHDVHEETVQSMLNDPVWLPDTSFENQFTTITTEETSRESSITQPNQKCRLCNALFRKASQLREHMKEHSKVKASLSRRNHKRNIDRSSFIHKCKECQKGFQKPSQLVRHMRIHTGEKPYECSFCGKAFNQKGSLQIHMTKHTGDKPFTCEFCSAGFRQRGNLRAHILRVHTIPCSGEPTFRCCECPCVFRKLGSLNAHVSRVHGNTGTTAIVNATVAALKKRKRDGSEEESVEDEVMRHLAALEEATKNLAVSDEDIVKETSSASTSNNDVPCTPIEEASEIVVSSNRREVSADILQQALENSGLTSEAKKEETSSAKETKTEKKASEGEKKTEESPKAAGNNSCVLTLADKAHDGSVRRYNIKVRRAGGVRWHQCTYCIKEFKKPSDLVRHIRIHTHEKPYKCNQCFRAFAVKSTLTVHLRIHSGLKSYECVTCKKKFASQSSLKVHQRLHSGLKPFSCPHCPLRFRTTGHQKAHISSHFRIRPKVKKEKKAGNEDSGIKRVLLQEPIIIKQNVEGDPSAQVVENPLPEEIVNKIAAVLPEGAVAEQMREIRPYKCDECHAAFKKQSHLRQHMRSHTGEKPFGCLSCNKAFVSRGVLRAHIKTHIPFMSPLRRPHECSECGRKFVAAGSLKRHIINAHENLRKTILKQTYLCPYCPTPPFNSNKACRKHIMTHSDELLAAQQQEQQAQQIEQQVQQMEQQIEQQVQQMEEVEQHEVDDMNTLNVQNPDPVDSGMIQEEHVMEATETIVMEADDRLEAEVDSAVANNVVVTFSLNFQTADGFEQQVNNHCTIEESVVEATSQPVATISLPEPLTQESLRQIEQTLGSGMFTDADAMVAHPSEAAAEGSVHVKDQTLDFEAHTIAFDPSVFSTITLPSGEGLNLHQTLETMEQPVEVKEKFRKKKIHKCSYCNRVFKKYSHLKPHLRSHTGEKPFQCIICLRMFVTMGTLKAHLRTHTGEKSFSCATCGATFTTNGSLTRHQSLHSDHNRPFQCERCPLSFCTKGQWRRHWRSHEAELIGKEATQEVAQTEEVGPSPEPERPPPKPPQPRAVSQTKRVGGRRRVGETPGAGVIRLSEEETARLALQSPSQPHLSLSERVLIASAAEKERISEINERERQLQHAPKLPHVCSHCPKSFRKPSDLQRHIRTHTGERPFECDKCGRRFTVKSTLDSHRLTHPEDGHKQVYHPKYPCHVCGCLFATKGSLKVHMRLHTGARPFKCPYCELRFRTSGHRKAHLLTHLRPAMMDGKRRGRKPKAVAISEAIRSMDASLQDNTAAENPSSDVVEDWGTLQANLGGGSGAFQLQLENGSLSLQLDEGLLRQMQQQGLVQEEDAEPKSSADETTEKVSEQLVFETGDVGSLFGSPLQVILDDTKRRGMENAMWADNSEPLVIDGDFVLEEEGTLRQVIGGEYVVVTGLQEEKKQ